MLARDDDAVGGARNRALGGDPQIRLVLGDAGAVLHFAERVEHRDVGDAPPFGEPHARPAGHPVVAVHKVVRHAFAPGE